MQYNSPETPEDNFINQITFLKLADDLGIDAQNDIGMLLLAWKLNTSTLWSISKDEWITGWSVHGCHSLEDIKEKIKFWEDMIRQDDFIFTKFYKFIFNYLKEDKRIIAIDEAILIWDLTIKPKGWKLYDEWIKFCKEKQKCVSIDGWISLLDFMRSYPDSLQNYDELASWPCMYDEFNAWAKGES